MAGRGGTSTWRDSGRTVTACDRVKVFVSGQIDEKEAVQLAYKTLENAGFRVTHDWTMTDPLIDRDAQRDEAGHRASLDITGVVEADVYILMSDNKKAGKGMYVELGAALALQERLGTPDVYVVGPMNHMSIFYLHPRVKHRESIEDVIEELRASLAPVVQADEFGLY